MENFKRLLNHSLIALCLLATSCGYMSDKPVENIDVYKTDELQTCKIDLTKLGEIFKTDQKEQIRCLQENFVQFTKYVRAKHPGTVTEAELGIFVKKFFEGQSESIIKGLSLIFQLNMILLKDEADRISNTKISPLFELLVQVNQEAVILTNILKEMDKPENQNNFWIYKEKFGQSLNRFSKSAVSAIDASPGMPKKLNMREFVIDMSKKIGDSNMDPETITCFIFIKKMVVGGDEEVITTNELRDLIAKLPRLLNLVFDVYYVKAENFKDTTSELRFYLSTTRQFFNAVKFDQPDFELVSSQELVDLAKKFIKKYDIDTFRPSIETLKVKFVGGKKNSITLKDLEVVVDMVEDFFEKSYFNYVTYEDPTNKLLLNKTTPIKDKEITLRALPGYDVISEKDRLEQLFASFNDTVVNFRYFRDSTKSALYDKTIARNVKGFNEVNIAKWLSFKLLKAYGKIDSKGNMQLSMDQFSQFLLDTKPILVELKLWSPNFSSFSRNAVLLADLFQQQSNGDQLININEATEYIGMLLTAVDVSGLYSETLTSLCDPGINTDDPVYETNCYNQNFYEVFLNKLGYKKSLPRLNNYYRSASKEETMGYLKGVEGFARDDNAPGVPVNRRDSTLIVGAILNIETTFIRFDKNNDNIIDYDELTVAFATYKASIISLADLKPDQEKYAKGIFLYMVSRMEIPETGSIIKDAKFAAFNYCVERDWCRKTLDPIEAKRLNIGKLLYYMVNQASTTPPTPSNK